MAYLDNNGVLYLWGKIKAHVSTAISGLSIPTKTSDLTNDSGFLTAHQDLSAYALKSDLASMYKYKGSVATVANLPSTGNTTGDVYNVESTGMNYAWNGSAWDALGESVQITAITNAELDTICT